LRRIVRRERRNQYRCRFSIFESESFFKKCRSKKQEARDKKFWFLASDILPLASQFFNKVNTMTQQEELRSIRTIQEQEEIFALNAIAFSKGTPPTPPEFFPHHVLDDARYRLEQTRALFVNGKIVSAVSVFDRAMWVFGKEIPYGGIGDVSTLPSEQGKGYSSKVMRDVIEFMKAKGYPLSVLFTGIQPYYEKFGFQIAPQTKMVIERFTVERNPDVRIFDWFKDLEQVQSVHRAFNQSRLFACARTEADWLGQHKYAPEDNHGFLVLEEDGRIIGYVRSKGKENMITVWEFGCVNNTMECFTTLVGHLFRRFNAEKAEIILPVNDFLLQHFDGKFTTHSHTMMMFAVLNTARLAEMLGGHEAVQRFTQAVLNGEATFWLPDEF
jgi:predicted N-acetyltransferase YhbS